MPDVAEGGGLPIMRVIRYVFGLVAVVAGIFGAIMLIAPGDTDTYFSWPIGPEPVAATVGGCYLASAIVFAIGAWCEEWVQVRPLCFAALGLTVPTLVATLYDSDVFDFGRVLAIVWLVLFTVSPIVFIGLLWVQRDAVAPDSPPLTTTARVLFGLLGLGFTWLAVAAWIDPGSLGDHAPFAMVKLSGRFLGSWCAFLAVLALYSAVRNRRLEAFVPAIGLTVVPLFALVGALRTWDDMAGGGGRAGYVFALVILTVVGAALVTSTLTGEDATPASA
jgi:hypothetical protein